MNCRELFQNSAINISFDEPMSKHTTFGIGGTADVFAVPVDESELLQLLNTAKQNDVPVFFLGNGSNVLVRDEGIRGLVISMKGLKNITIQDTSVAAGAGVLLAQIANVAADNDLSGLEFAAGIPGTVGGAVYMNAGAYDGQMSDVIYAVRVLQQDGKIITIGINDLDFAYRFSSLQNTNDIIVSASFCLQQGHKADIQKKMQIFQQKRSAGQPLNFFSAGSVFKRPVGHYAGALIDECGLKGLIVGKAKVSEKHAGFIVNTGGAKALDVLTLIKQIQDTVWQKKDIKLETEIVVVGGK